MNHPGNTDVCVIGAGFAGLAAARSLADDGFRPLVLEASDGIGGRSRSVGLGDGVIDPGASWIHHPDGNPLSELCDRYGVTRLAFDLDDLTESQQLHDGRPLSAGESRCVVSIEEEFWISFEPADLSADTSMRAVVERFFAGRRDDENERRARVIIECSIETELCSGLDEIAASNFDSSTKPYGGGDDMIVGGYGRLASHLARGIDVRCGSEVERVVQSGTGVAVQLSDGTRIVAASAIVAVPLGVLKSDSIVFEPALPSSMRRAVERLGFGTFEKVFLQFPARWWTARAKPEGLYLLDADVFRYWLDITEASGPPSLVAHVAGSVAAGLADDPRARVEQALGALRRHVSNGVPPVVNAHATSWSEDRFTRGAYTRLRPGVDRGDISRLGRPHHRVVLAGEHTSPTRHGYVDGAYGSGLRAADQVIRLLRRDRGT